MAVGQSSGPGLGADAWNRLGARHLLCRCNHPVFQILVYRAYRPFNLDSALFHCCGMAFDEAGRTLTESRCNAAYRADRSLGLTRLRDGASCAKIFHGFVDSGPSADFNFVLLNKRVAV